MGEMSKIMNGCQQAEPPALVERGGLAPVGAEVVAQEYYLLKLALGQLSEADQLTCSVITYSINLLLCQVFQVPGQSTAVRSRPYGRPRVDIAEINPTNLSEVHSPQHSVGVFDVGRSPIPSGKDVVEA